MELSKVKDNRVEKDPGIPFPVHGRMRDVLEVLVNSAEQAGEGAHGPGLGDEILEFAGAGVHALEFTHGRGGVATTHHRLTISSSMILCFTMA